MCKNKLYLVRKSGDDCNHNMKVLGQEDCEPRPHSETLSQHTKKKQEF